MKLLKLLGFKTKICQIEGTGGSVGEWVTLLTSCDWEGHLPKAGTMWQKEFATKRLIFLRKITAHQQCSVALSPPAAKHTHTHCISILFPSFLSRQRPILFEVLKRQYPKLPTSMEKGPGEPDPWTVAWSSHCPPALLPTLGSRWALPSRSGLPKQGNVLLLCGKEQWRIRVVSDPMDLT